MIDCLKLFDRSEASHFNIAVHGSNILPSDSHVRREIESQLGVSLSPKSELFFEVYPNWIRLALAEKGWLSSCRFEDGLIQRETQRLDCTIISVEPDRTDIIFIEAKYWASYSNDQIQRYSDCFNRIFKGVHAGTDHKLVCSFFLLGPKPPSRKLDKPKRAPAWLYDEKRNWRYICLEEESYQTKKYYSWPAGDGRMIEKSIQR